MNATIQFYPQPNQSQMGFIMRGAPNLQQQQQQQPNNIRFQNPQNFIHQQPPPSISHNSPFGVGAGQRGQIMTNTGIDIGNNSIAMFQPTSTAGQTTIHMMQPQQLSSGSVMTTQHFITTSSSGGGGQSDMGNVYQQSSNFITSPSHGNFSKPHQMTMTSSSASQPMSVSQQPAGVGNNLVSGMISVGNYQQQQQQQQQARSRQWQ